MKEHMSDTESNNESKSAEQLAEQWAIVELMGHARIAGRISESNFGGGHFVRIDVPKTTRQPEFTRLYGPPAIYSITFVGKEIAEAAAEEIGNRPVVVYMPKLKMLDAGQQHFIEERGDEEE